MLAVGLLSPGLQLSLRAGVGWPQRGCRRLLTVIWQEKRQQLHQGLCKALNQCSTWHLIKCQLAVEAPGLPGRQHAEGLHVLQDPGLLEERH